ncbi:NAD(P)/FAD-dependent oxidoreductase [Aquihabitans daechungensis]|uniref:NAD(P)/FAD-dependent oxidoreductase n=1 Tax=Aquihabitans daechungensis TaxID=1052257 RepID=UPI003B9F739E
MVDVAVVGLGLIGGGALRHLAATGADAVGVGPGEPPVFSDHRGVFASHYDSGRITRRLDPRREWAVLAARSIAGYPALEAASGIAFHRPVGAVMAERDPDRIASTLANAAAMDVPVTVLPTGAPSPWGDLLAFPPDGTLLAEAGPAGHVDPRRMLAANLAVARTEGAAVVVDEVTAIEPGAHGWRLHTSRSGTIAARRVLVTAGPHADEVLAGPIGHDASPRFEVRGETVVLATVDEAEQQRLAAMPSVLARMDHPTYADLYVVPATSYPDGSIRLKLGATRSSDRELRTPEEKRAWMRGDEHREELPELGALLEELVPGLRASYWETKPCLITETPSNLPVVEHLAPGLVIAAGGNGYAAKSANAIGALAADLLVAGRWSDPDLDAGAFRR